MGAETGGLKQPIWGCTVGNKRAEELNEFCIRWVVGIKYKVSILWYNTKVFGQGWSPIRVEGFTPGLIQSGEERSCLQVPARRPSVSCWLLTLSHAQFLATQSSPQAAYNMAVCFLKPSSQQGSSSKTRAAVLWNDIPSSPLPYSEATQRSHHHSWRGVHWTVTSRKGSHVHQPRIYPPPLSYIIFLLALARATLSYPNP